MRSDSEPGKALPIPIAVPLLCCIQCRSIRVVFVMLCIVQITLCAALCSYLGYANAKQVTRRLSADVVSERFFSVRAQVDSALSNLLPATDDLHRLMLPAVPTIVQSNTAVNVSRFWNFAIHQRQRSMAWSTGGQAPYMYGCFFNQVVSIGLSPERSGPYARCAVSDGTMPPGKGASAYLPVEINRTLMEANWGLDQTRVPEDATFDSLLAGGHLLNVSLVDFTMDTKSWYHEGMSHGSSLAWNSPYIARDGQLLVGVTKGFVMQQQGVNRTVGACMTQIGATHLRTVVSSVPHTRVAQYLIVRNTGRLLMTSIPGLFRKLNASESARVWLQNCTKAAEVSIVSALMPELLRARLISLEPEREPINVNHDPLSVFDVDVTFEGDSLLCRVSPLATPGFGAFLVACFYEKDFDSGSAQLLTFSVVATVVVLVCSVLVTCVVINMVWRGISQVAHFMNALENSSFGAATTAPGAAVLPAAASDVMRIVKAWDAYIQSIDRPTVASWCCPRTISLSDHDEDISGHVKLESSGQKAGTAITTAEAGSTLKMHTAPSAIMPTARVSNSVRSDHDLTLEMIDESHSFRSSRIRAYSRDQSSTRSTRRTCCCWVKRMRSTYSNAAADKSPHESFASGSPTPGAALVVAHDVNGPEDSQRQRPCCCGPSAALYRRTSSFSLSSPHKLELWEPALMRRTFGGLLKSICGYQDEVERILLAKRHFIRYIFHEVRVPFNSVVLCE